MSVRELVYLRMSTDTELSALGLTGATLYANGAPDSPQERFWGVLRWGIEIPGVRAQRGRDRVTDRECTLWVYNKSPEYDPINSAIKRWCAILDALEATKTGDAATDGWILTCEWTADIDDGYDDVYEAWYRSSGYRIIASGD